MNEVDDCQCPLCVLRRSMSDAGETPMVLRLPKPNKLIGFEESEVLAMMNEDYPNPHNFNALFVRALFVRLRAERTGITEQVFMECVNEVITNAAFTQMMELSTAPPASNSIH